MTDKAKAAITAVLRRIKDDPRVAYYICPMTQTYDLLVAAYCEFSGMDEQTFRNGFESGLKFEGPRADE
jgi:hypothetical protein